MYYHCRQVPNHKNFEFVVLSEYSGVKPQEVTENKFKNEIKGSFSYFHYKILNGMKLKNREFKQNQKMAKASV